MSFLSSPLGSTVMSQVTRDYLHPKEIDRLLNAAKSFLRYGIRSYALVLTAFRLVGTWSLVRGPTDPQ